MARMKNVDRFFITLILGIIIGMLIGSIIVTVFVSYKLDNYYQRINIYYNMLEEKDAQLKKIEESLNKNRYILKDVIIEIEEFDDEIDEVELKKHIKEKYINLIGKEIKDIDIEIISEIVDNRIMKLEEISYKIKVTKIMISDTLQIYIQVKEVE